MHRSKLSRTIALTEPNTPHVFSSQHSVALGYRKQVVPLSDISNSCFSHNSRCVHSYSALGGLGWRLARLVLPSLTTPMSLLLQKLSIELLHEIVLLLPTCDIRACRQTCKGFSRLIGDSLLLPYILSRENSCIVDIPSTDMPVKCRLEALQRWERAWDVLRMRTLVRDMQVPGGKDDLLYTICANFLIGVRYGSAPGYYYLPIHDPILPSSHGDYNWTWVDFQPYGRQISSVFAVEQNMTVITSVFK
jgi:hypothetical protein